MRTFVIIAAFTWGGLWLTQDQQGQRLFEQGEFTEAAATFRDPMWQGNERSEPITELLPELSLLAGFGNGRTGGKTYECRDVFIFHAEWLHLRSQGLGCGAQGFVLC